jgi:hypothetical protein
VYVFIRRRGYARDESEDLTQGFFALLIERNYLLDADSKRGRFRSFLLGAVQHFLANEWDRENAVKRGGGQVAVCIDNLAEAEVWHALPAMQQATPESLYERRWALSLLENVASRLRKEFADAGKEGEFDKLSLFEQGFEAVSLRRAGTRNGYVCRSIAHVGLPDAAKVQELAARRLPKACPSRGKSTKSSDILSSILHLKQAMGDLRLCEFCGGPLAQAGSEQMLPALHGRARPGALITPTRSVHGRPALAHYQISALLGAGGMGVVFKQRTRVSAAR